MKKGKMNKNWNKVRRDWERGLGREGKGGNKYREVISQHEGGGWQRGKEAPHLACALDPATWGSGPGISGIS